MTLGTKTLLFGVHQIFIHPFMVAVAWVVLYRSFPSWRELVCIFIHDWGYWGKKDLKGKEGDTHPELGARIASRLLGEEWGNFILGHSTYYAARKDIGTSKLMAPDKHWHCIVPFWFYALLSIPTGELRHYREMKHARQVTSAEATDREWFLKLQGVCSDKVVGIYKIDKDNLSGAGNDYQR